MITSESRTKSPVVLLPFKFRKIYAFLIEKSHFVIQICRTMNKKPFFILGALAIATATADAALVWQVGMDDDGWPVGDGGGPNATFVQENGAVNALPGSPVSTEVPSGADNDYYFAGDYSATIAANGAYAPVGVVVANEEAAERAYAGGDVELRYHFNLPSSFSALDQLTVTFDANNLDTGGGADPRWGVEIYINNFKVMSEVIIRPGDLGFDYASTPVSLADAGAVVGPGADNIVTLKGISYNGAGGGNWMGIDYVQLDVTPIPEPGSSTMVLLGAMGCAGLFGRRRSRR